MNIGFLKVGRVYDIKDIRLVGWSTGDGSGSTGYELGEYFDNDGRYMGPDQCGIEPIVEVNDGCQGNG